MKKTLSLILCCCLLAGLVSGCAAPGGHDTHTSPEQGGVSALPEAELSLSSADAGENRLRAALLYWDEGEADTAGWQERFERLAQPLLLNLELEAVDASQEHSLGDFDLVYADESLLRADGAKELAAELMDYTAAGGGLFLTNAFYDFFEPGFLGAKRFRELEGFPAGAVREDCGADLSELQELTCDFLELCEGRPELEGMSPGVGMEPSTAVALCSSGGLALSAVNAWGEGYVLFCTAYLPSPQLCTGSEGFGGAAVSAARLLENAFAAFIQKRSLGYAVWRVYGAMGSPGMCWQAELSELAGMESGAGLDFAELCREYLQAPSLLLSRLGVTHEPAAVVSTLSGGASGFTAAENADENLYGAGACVLSGDSWLSFGEGFTAVEACDLDGDGRQDLVIGGPDGELLFCRGRGYTDRLRVDAAEPLTDAEGEALVLSGGAAPLACDYDGDGVTDLLCGSGDGLVYLYLGLGGLAFEPMGPVADTGLGTLVLPELGDMDGDGLPDLICGSDAGRVLIFAGSGTGFAAEAAELGLLELEGGWFAPCARDFSGDGLCDLLLGCADGRVALLLNNGRLGFSSAGYVQAGGGQEDAGDAYFGANCVPAAADIDGDGLPDLVCSGVQEGLSCPIDSGFFPCKAELMSQLKSLREAGTYIGAVCGGGYKGPLQAASELGAQLEAFAVYSLVSNRLGAALKSGLGGSEERVLAEVGGAGLLWATGFDGGGLPLPVWAAGSELLLLGGSTPQSDNSLAVKYGLPLCLYADCSDPELESRLQDAQVLRAEGGYAFMMENQLISACAAAWNLSLDLVGNSEERFDIELVGSGETNRFALYSGDWQGAVGARVSLGEALAGRDIRTDADVWRRVGDELYVSLNRPVRVYEAAEGEGGDGAGHLCRVNLPATVSASDSGATVSFREGGCMEVESSCPAVTESAGWTATPLEGGGTLFTKYGAASSLSISYE